MTTKAAFLAEYEKLVRAMPWAIAEPGKVPGFMVSVRDTVTTEHTHWVWNGPGAKATWKAIGCKGKMTLKALRALP